MDEQRLLDIIRQIIANGPQMDEEGEERFRHNLAFSRCINGITELLEIEIADLYINDTTGALWMSVSITNLDDPDDQEWTWYEFNYNPDRYAYFDQDCGITLVFR